MLMKAKNTEPILQTSPRKAKLIKTPSEKKELFLTQRKIVYVEARFAFQVIS